MMDDECKGVLQRDIALLQVSVEALPRDLPPLGELTWPTLRAGMPVLAMRNMFRSWVRARVIEPTGKSVMPGVSRSSCYCATMAYHVSWARHATMTCHVTLTCHITLTCHVTMRCHVTISCHITMSCHVTIS
jgi:hypothetical protein